MMRAVVVAVALALTCATVGAVAPPTCASEDAPGPCVWDAQTQGNGQGRSFYVDAAQTVHYR